MKNKYNIYIDESCHLEHNRTNVMCIGYLKINSSDYNSLKEKIKKLKLKHLSPTEIKWNTLSMSRWNLYKELIDFFFVNNIEFRGTLIKDKQNLSPEKLNKKDQNSYYYKTLVLLLNNKIHQGKSDYKVYLDVKDTRGKSRLRLLDKELQEALEGNSPFTYFQHLHSNENEFLQLTDLFIGAICFKARNLSQKENASKIKLKVVDYIENFYGYLLDESTEPWETKFFIDDFRIKPSKP